MRTRELTTAELYRLASEANCNHVTAAKWSRGGVVVRAIALALERAATELGYAADARTRGKTRVA